MVVADKNISLTLTGTGDVIEPNDGIIAIGSGGTYALACARGLIDMPDIDAETIALKSMKVRPPHHHHPTIESTTDITTRHDTTRHATHAGGG
jgi:S-adenosylmethionine:diacylglycerol 3-amino-3-carboxypropyl transferase